MSAMNHALSELANKDQTLAVPIVKAQIKKVKSGSPVVWIVFGFSLSLAVGGWAVSQQSDMIVTADSAGLDPNLKQTSNVAAQVQVVAETKLPIKSRSTEIDSVTPEKTIQAVTIFEPVNQVKKKALQATTQKPVTVAKVTRSEPSKPAVEPLKSVKVVKLNKQPIKQELRPKTKKVSESEMIVEEVELTPDALAQNALSRAKKALDSNDMNGALSNYSEVLRYTPKNEIARQKLAVLYYGKGDARKAYNLLQYGIKLSPNSEELRLGLSKLLIKEKQPEVALSPLLHLPPNPSINYLAMRAALGQKSKQGDVTLESYMQLVDIEPENGRWWLGLAIQQERNMDFESAIKSYKQALSLVGISKSSQNFVRDRMSILSNIQESASAN